MRLRAEELSRLDAHRDRIVSRAGGFLGGQALFAGLVASSEIAGRMGITEATLTGLLGRAPSAREIDLFEILLCINVYPDPRIWCMRAGAYAAALGSTFSAAYAASTVAIHARILGSRPMIECGGFLRRAAAALAAGETADSFIERELGAGGLVPGYGRPITNADDERVTRVLELMEERGFRRGPCLEAFLACAPPLLLRKRIRPNFAGIAAAVVLDPPFSVDAHGLALCAQIVSVVPLLFSVLDAERHREENDPFLPLRIDDTEYSGPPPRPLPKKKGK